MSMTSGSNERINIGSRAGLSISIGYGKKKEKKESGFHRSGFSSGKLNIFSQRHKFLLNHSADFLRILCNSAGKILSFLFPAELRRIRRKSVEYLQNKNEVFNRYQLMTEYSIPHSA